MIRQRSRPGTRKLRTIDDAAKPNVLEAMRRGVTSVLVLISLASCGTGTITRVRAGHSYEERSIDARAYAAYARGRLYEAQGDLSRAAAQYRAVVALDPEAGEAWVRLGAVHCIENPKPADHAWDKAARLDPESPKLWAEKARCELRHNHSRAALQFAQLAMRFDPTSVDAVSLVATAAGKLNRSRDGLAWLYGAAAMNPTNAYLWRLILATNNLPIAERRYAAAQLAKLRPPDSIAILPAYSSVVGSNQTTQAAWARKLEQDLEDGFSADDVVKARRIATMLGLNPEQLARRAVLAGAYDTALQEADLILEVASDNAIAWIVGLLAADRMRDESRLDERLFAAALE